MILPESDKEKIFFICYKGLERSPLATRWFKEVGYCCVDYFRGGTFRLQTCEEILAYLIPVQSWLYFIRDPKDGKEAVDAYESSMYLVDQLAKSQNWTVNTITFSEIEAQYRSLKEGRGRRGSKGI